MKILVTGGGGFLGSEIVTQLHQAGHEVLVVLPMPIWKSSGLNKFKAIYQLIVNPLSMPQLELMLLSMQPH